MAALLTRAAKRDIDRGALKRDWKDSGASFAKASSLMQML